MIDSIEMELMEIRHVYVEKSEALEAFDQGEYVFDSPERGMMVPVRRSDISDADEGTFFRMQREEWKNYKNVQAEMDLVPAVTSIKEARLLLMQENSFGIYIPLLRNCHKFVIPVKLSKLHLVLLCHIMYLLHLYRLKLNYSWMVKVLYLVGILQICI